ncbi:MAG: hypothetical protein ACTSRR_11865 [Candidatus Heimdallarchaeaceae archaeon]
MLKDVGFIPTTPGLPFGSYECPGSGDEPLLTQSSQLSLCLLTGWVES